MTSGLPSSYPNPRVAALLIPILLLAVPGGGLATTLQRFSLAQLTANSTRIFLGRCHSADTEIEAGQVYTHFLFSVEQVIKGDRVKEVDLHLMGGEFEGVRQTIVGMPTFMPGERIILFLTADDHRGHAWPVGLGQGKFRVVSAASDQEPRVFQALSSSAELIALADGTAKPPAAAATTDGLYLSDFLSLVRELAGAGAGEEKPHAH